MLRRAIQLLFLLACAGLATATTRSPENQVFQFEFTGTSAPWPDGSTRTATLYLWVPEDCVRVRGLVILATNVPEHMLAGHEAIRRACRENQLALVWGVPTFWRFGKVAPAPGQPPVEVRQLPGSDARQVEFLEQLLTGLARTSGYEEIAQAPWLPIGESGHLLMVTGLVNERPQRSLAAICVKNPQAPREFSVPMLWTLGTGQEWGQSKVDVREHWRNTGNYDAWVGDRLKRAWPLSLIIEPGTGHFYCSDAMVEHFARYIGAAVRHRLPAEDGAPLRPVDLASGATADLAVPGATAGRGGFWYFDRELARDAQQLSIADWSAPAQFVGFVPGAGVRAEPFALNSVTKLSITTDGEFEVGAELLDQIPAGFVGAGEPLACAASPALVEWICGPFAPVAPGRFRIALDRTWKTGAASYLIARHEGDATARRTVQPAHVTLVENNVGVTQTISFAPLPDVPAGTRSVPLRAVSDRGLPVQFFVVSGPAVVRDGQLVFTAVPPRAKWPVNVTVAAWQWGRASAPQIRTAPIVRRTFRLLAPPSAPSSSP